MKNTTLYVNLVKEFHTAFEQPVYKSPEDAPTDVHRLRARLIKEEYGEYLEATDRVDILDALCDLIYVVAGTAVTYSVPIDGYSSNQLKLPLTKKPIIDNRVLFVLQDLYSLFPCPKMQRKGLNELLCLLDDVCRAYGFKMPEAFIRVHRNNMEKLWDTHPNDMTLKQPHGLTATKKGDRWLVRDAGGKIAKPPGHTKVDLSSCV